MHTGLNFSFNISIVNEEKNVHVIQLKCISQQYNEENILDVKQTRLLNTKSQIKFLQYCDHIWYFLKRWACQSE